MFPIWLLLLACEADIEGDVAGECGDGADNDRDGAFDCDDPDCLGAPACAADSDPTDTDVKGDPDTPPVEPPTCADWTPGVGARPPGPHIAEVGLVSAWLIDPTSGERTFSPECRDTTDEDWQPLFELGSEKPEPGRYNYVFYEVGAGCDAAEQFSCPGAECYPECCTGTGRAYTWSDGAPGGSHGWRAAPEAITEGLDALLVPGCTITVEQTPWVEDDGTTGVLTYRRAFTVAASCPAALRQNRGCVVDFNYQLDWVKAE